MADQTQQYDLQDAWRQMQGQASPQQAFEPAQQHSLSGTENRVQSELPGENMITDAEPDQVEDNDLSPQPQLQMPQYGTVAATGLPTAAGGTASLGTSGKSRGTGGPKRAAAKGAAAKGAAAKRARTAKGK